MKNSNASIWETISTPLNIFIGAISIISFIITIAVLFFGDSLFLNSTDLRHYSSNPMKTSYGFSKCVFVVNRGISSVYDVQIIAKPEITTTLIFYDERSFNSSPKNQ